MSFLSLAELFGAYCVVAFIIAAACLAAFINLYGDVPLLDGTRLQSALDDRDRSHLVDAALAEDREVAALDALWEMEPREHPPLGWTS